VVEKEGVFQRLVEEEICEKFNCLIVTGKGFPDLATRAFLHHLSSSYSDSPCPIFGICDCNPYGLALLLTYKVGSCRMGGESFHYGVDLEWIGLKPSQVNRLRIPSYSMQEMVS